MKYGLLIALFGLVSCTTYVKTVGTRMVSPEAHGELGKGAVDLRMQSSKRDKMDFADNSTKNPLIPMGTQTNLALLGELGLGTKLDAFIIPSLAFSPTIYGLKFQVYGEPRKEAKKGNTSVSLMAGLGEEDTGRIDDENDLDILDSSLDAIEYNLVHQDVGLIVGHRVSDDILAYINTIYFHEEISGKATTNDAVLVNAPFEYDQNGMIYSIGGIYYKNKMQFKLDYSHMTSAWSRTKKQTFNTVNAAIGMNW